MNILVTGSSGNLGAALVITCRMRGINVTGLDVRPSENTTHVGSVTDRAFIDRHMDGVDIVFHSAGLHKPHIATHTYNGFIQTNITGTTHLLQSAARHGVKKFIMASTTSIYGDTLHPSPDSPAVWIDESTEIKSKNIYGVTKLAAEALCRMESRNEMDCIVLRLSRFFYEEDDDPHIRSEYTADNAKVNELLFRRVDIEDVVNAHFAAINYMPPSGFDLFVISATTPFTPACCAEIRHSPETVLHRLYPEYSSLYGSLGWRMFPEIGRVYSSGKARELLPGWEPQYSFRTALRELAAGGSFRSALASEIGWRRYHPEIYDGMPYPILHAEPPQKALRAHRK